ncbi:MAG: helix-turn-helix transcriptional regulator [Gammaproteobacteria bacterium]|nr:helix-turn-helix transcriptional regulator [Gammaproteobacteria bacterium]
MIRDRGYRWSDLGARMREARKRVGLTQRQLSELVGVASHTVWAWEAGRMKPQHEHLVEVAFHCETSTERLLGQPVEEAELLKAAEVSFHDALAGLPPEDIESIRKFIKFVRAERRRTRRSEGPAEPGH